MTPTDDLFRDIRILPNHEPKLLFHFFVRAGAKSSVCPFCPGDAPITPDVEHRPDRSLYRGTTPEGAPIVWREGEDEPVSPSAAGLETVE